MRYRKWTAALTATALICSPMPSFAQTAPQPAASQEAGLQLAQGYEPGRPRKKRRLIWYILGGVAIVVAACVIFICKSDDDGPISP